MPNDMHAAEVLEGREIQTETGMVALIASAEIDQQIATAHKYPRSVSNFRKEALAMVTLSEVIAQECIYALPRDGKVIQGPSARFAEIMLHAWGNARAGARVVHEEGDFIVSQGVCHDLQRNVAITFEVRRRITDKKGHRYSPDMIGVTANAASSIALRNSILKVVPKAFWSELYTAALKTAVGDVKTLANKRADAVTAFQHYGVSEVQILAKLGRGGIQDVTLDDLQVLFGILTAIKDAEITPEEAFALDANAKPAVTMPREKAEAQPEQGQQEQAVEGEHIPREQPKEKEAIPAKPSMLKMIRTKAEQAALSTEDLAKRLGRTRPAEMGDGAEWDPLEGITVEQGNDLLEFIRNPGA